MEKQGWRRGTLNILALQMCTKQRLSNESDPYASCSLLDCSTYFSSLSYIVQLSGGHRTGAEAIDSCVLRRAS